MRSSIVEMFGVSSMNIGASRQGVHRGRETREVDLLEEAGAQVLAVDVRDAREHAEHQLLLAHLQAEHADGPLVADGRVLRDVQGEARLPDRRSGREDDEVAALQAGRQRVEVLEAGGDAADLAAVRVEVIEAVVCGVEQVAKARETRHRHAAC